MVLEDKRELIICLIVGVILTIVIGYFHFTYEFNRSKKEREEFSLHNKNTNTKHL